MVLALSIKNSIHLSLKQIKAFRMTVKEIRQAVNCGQKVYYTSSNYKVVRKGLRLVVLRVCNGCTFPLLDDRGRLDGREQDFFIAQNN